MRQIVLDTETTGLEPQQGHRIIEIGCVEMIDRRTTGSTYHVYLNPDREIDEGAEQVHGISNEFLQDKPRFAHVASEFFEYIKGAELIIHNAPFDVGFINHEFKLLNGEADTIGKNCSVIDTLVLARKKHPGQKNNLDALTKRYDITHFQRDLHGALLDSQILADVYLAMTGGQTTLMLQGDVEEGGEQVFSIKRVDADRPALKVIAASKVEKEAHEAQLDLLQKSSGSCVWRED